MPNLNIEFTEQEYAKFVLKKIAESKRQKKELNWKEFLTRAVEQVQG